MARTLAWTTDEFAALMRSPHLTEIEATHIPALCGRSADAIAVVRQGVHSWHQGRRETTLLSAHMKRRLLPECAGLGSASGSRTQVYNRPTDRAASNCKSSKLQHAYPSQPSGTE